MTENLINRISFYLASGGLFNPELADHIAVRTLLFECREALAQRTWVGLTDKDWNRSKHNYDFQKGVDFVMNPDLVSTPMYAALTAGWFWDVQKLNQYADSRDYKTMTKKINGGFIGLDDRIKHINHAIEVLT